MTDNLLITINHNQFPFKEGGFNPLRGQNNVQALAIWGPFPMCFPDINPSPTKMG
jgi:predicted molibdopterin-dependent oxidoreductase YjgC